MYQTWWTATLDPPMLLEWIHSHSCTGQWNLFTIFYNAVWGVLHFPHKKYTSAPSALCPSGLNASCIQHFAAFPTAPHRYCRSSRPFTRLLQLSFRASKRTAMHFNCAYTSSTSLLFSWGYTLPLRLCITLANSVLMPRAHHCFWDIPASWYLHQHSWYHNQSMSFLRTISVTHDLPWSFTMLSLNPPRLQSPLAGRQGKALGPSHIQLVSSSPLPVSFLPLYQDAFSSFLPSHSIHASSCRKCAETTLPGIWSSSSCLQHHCLVSFLMSLPTFPTLASFKTFAAPWYRTTLHTVHCCLALCLPSLGTSISISFWALGVVAAAIDRLQHHIMQQAGFQYTLQDFLPFSLCWWSRLILLLFSQPLPWSTVAVFPIVFPANILRLFAPCSCIGVNIYLLFNLYTKVVLVGESADS